MIERTARALMLPAIIFVLSLPFLYYGWVTGDRALILVAGITWIYIAYHTSIIQSAITCETTAATTRKRKIQRDSKVDRKNIDTTAKTEDFDETQGEILEAELQL